jgi:hypothetical protein
MADKEWQDFIEKYPDMDLSEFNYLKEEAYIKKVGKEWCVFSEKGRRLGCYSTRPAAQRRLRDIEMFKHMKSDEEDTASSQSCYCTACGGYFTARNKRCDQAKCPNCGESDDIIEVTGIID